ncbi:hypothetical protein [Tenacibaculum salmonis]|uniref:hypothetical protein n=1 Tax=Tenacibaculum sp. P3-BQ1 TaxID=3232310 RepID=UPI0034E01E42
MKKRNRILAILLLVIIHFTNAQQKCEHSNEIINDLNSITKCTIEKKPSVFRKKTADSLTNKSVSRRSLIRRKRLKKMGIYSNSKKFRNLKKENKFTKRIILNN